MLHSRSAHFNDFNSILKNTKKNQILCLDSTCISTGDDFEEFNMRTCMQILELSNLAILLKNLAEFITVIFLLFIRGMFIYYFHFFVTFI
jgi:hypothetical protein